MIKRFVILRRKPSMSPDQFRQYWEKIHGPLIAKIPGLMKYTQYHVRSERLDNRDDPIDGIAELWFESEAAQRESYQSCEYQAVVDDEPNLFEMDSHFVHPVMAEKIVDLVNIAVSFNDVVHTYIKAPYVISTDTAKLHHEFIHKFLSTCYWSKDRTFAQVKISIENSYCFGMYIDDSLMGFARVIADFCTFAYLADVFVLPEHQGKGLGKWLISVIVATPELKNIEKWMLLTNDAHGIYENVDFQVFPYPERVMVKIKK